MRMTSSKVPTSAVLFLAVVLAAPLALADQKDDTYNRGTAAVTAGDSVAAANAFCSLPADFKDAGAQCAQYKPLADKALFRYKQNYAEGQAALQSGDFATAEIKFKNVKAGDFFSQAQKTLADIPNLRAKAQEAAAAGQNAENANKAKYDSGVSAFGQGNMDAAESSLSGVTGSHQAEAQTLLTKVRNYKAAVAKGQAFETARDFQAAKSAYAEAVNINPVGPATAALLRANAAISSPVPNNPPPNTTTTATVKLPPQPKPQIDVATYIADAQKALAKKDYKRAKALFTEVQIQDHNNQEAKDGLAEITSKSGPAKASDDDALLLDIVKTYYAGSYQDAEDRLKVYIYNNQGPKKGLANFYLGASMMTRYYLAGGTDDNLRREAKNKFKTAKDVQGFVPPEKFVSPKIMAAFKEAS